MDIQFNRISVGGFTNIGQISITLDNITSLIAPNNYGKSNVLKAVCFAFDFIKAGGEEKRAMMGRRAFIPINTHMADYPFSFELCGSMLSEDVALDFEYGFKFEWARTNSKEGSRIIEEHLRLKNSGESKYRQFIQRESPNEALYLPSASGRCNRRVALDGDMLAIEKLSYNDDLFYAERLRKLMKISVENVNTLSDPDEYLSGINILDSFNGYSLAMPKLYQISHFVNSLQKLDPDRYELLKNTILDLLPNIEEFTPVEVDMEGKTVRKVPYEVSDIFYDIRIKEKNNNQPTSISSVSTGCKKILILVVMIVAADINNIPLMMFEELENSVHPRLLQNILTTISALSGNTKVLITSHSPYLVKYLPAEKINVGLPSEYGIADFRTIRPGKIRKLVRQASAEEVSLGEYLFELMLDMEDDSDTIKEYF